MARSQSEPPLERLEDMLAKANALALSQSTAKSPDKPPAFCPAVLASAIERLDTLSREELIKLIRSVSGAVWGIGLLDEREIGELMLLKLAINGLTSSDAKKSVVSIREWLDRTKGKAVQTVQQSVQMSGAVAVMSGEEVQRLISDWIGGNVIENG